MRFGIRNRGIGLGFLLAKQLHCLLKFGGNKIGCSPTLQRAIPNETPEEHCCIVLPVLFKLRRLHQEVKVCSCLSVLKVNFKSIFASGQATVDVVDFFYLIEFMSEKFKGPRLIQAEFLIKRSFTFLQMQ
ncbi:hypothetical protein DsansV1_C24g0182961 [Dioscorea sansibarensis]